MYNKGRRVYRNRNQENSVYSRRLVLGERCVKFMQAQGSKCRFSLWEGTANRACSERRGRSGEPYVHECEETARQAKWHGARPTNRLVQASQKR